MTRRLSGPRMLVAAVLVATAGFATLRGQPERAPAEDMKALVAEVRALRLAVERTSAHNGQAQLLLGRVQLQENRLATLGRQLLEARTRVLDAQSAQAETEQQLRHLSDRSGDHCRPGRAPGRGRPTDAPEARDHQAAGAHDAAAGRRDGGAARPDHRAAALGRFQRPARGARTDARRDDRSALAGHRRVKDVSLSPVRR